MTDAVAAPSPAAEPRPRAELVYPFETPPPAGEALEVAPGVLWIRMPLPFTLSHINLWAIADGERWTLVDSGLRTPETADAWRRLRDGALGGRGVERIVVTHMHPDHVGMAGWITRRANCRLWMTRLEYLTCRVLVADTGRDAPDDGVRFYRRAGWDEDQIEHYRARFGEFGKSVYALPDSYRRIVDGETLRIGEHDWTVITGSGHSPEHACLYSASLKLMVSGDQVLPRISSNVSVFPTEPDADPLGDWLASLAKIRRLVPDDVLVLPAHNLPFRGLHARLDELAADHASGLAALRAKLARPHRAIEVFDALFRRPIDSRGLLGMATGETLAHLNRLIATGEATVELDGDGVAWYRAA
ncbi:MAG: MBL fold metallo-hydrolase [Burkholderiales bacterium]|jgi:glyoxylase-like metal-dependent hydrolase (beta-lactamase superfamily II)